jgi:membrane-bound serine protease (ClpP class)
LRRWYAARTAQRAVPTRLQLEYHLRRRAVLLGYFAEDAMKRCGPMLVAGLIFGAAAGMHAAPQSEVAMIHIEGTIGPATAGYISRAIDVATKRSDACLIITLNTPGGSLDATDQIRQKFYDSRVPVVVFVSPEGARAASAGTFITMAADIAAMTPNSRIGAAHPVGMSGEGDTNSVMWSKLENDTVGMIRGIAHKRNRNEEWAESAVRKSVSIMSEEALDLNVIDLIAKDIPDLLEKIDGRGVNGHTLRTAGATVKEIPMLFSEKLLQFFRPEVYFIFMLLAMYGIIAELNNPGAVLPGVVGAISLIIVLYMTAVLPVNLAGLALVVLAVALFIIDIYAPTHGVLTVGGVISFFLGALMLFNHAGPAFHLSLAYIIPATVTTALFFIFVVGAGVRAQRLPVRAGRETMVGKVVPALDRIDAGSGKVFVEGEYWNAVSEVGVEKDQPVEIIGVDGLVLKVKPKFKRELL